MYIRKIDKAKQVEIKRRFYIKQRALGLCLECINPVTEGHSRCSKCLARRLEKARHNKEEARQKGICVACLTQTALANNRICEICYFKNTARTHLGTGKLWKQLKDKFEEQKGKCALSGFPMTLGVNAELDHIMPMAKGGKRNLENTQWVLRVVNRMKRDLPESEFFTLVEALYNHMKQRKKVEPK
jgi:5-methylcytosine-specific restriction endonuclease McrA